VEMKLLLTTTLDPMKVHSICKKFVDLYVKLDLSYTEVEELVVIDHKPTAHTIDIYMSQFGASPYPVNNFSRA
jgi:hypothetical protein